jgi:predicted DNA-binding transcriptional regulator YafY
MVISWPCWRQDWATVRADRLVSTLLLLQSRGRMTAAEVADELGVSLRTARRDLEALNLAGVPVYSQAGRGGGWSLVGGARTDLTGFRSPEARALLVIAAASGAASSDFASAVQKLVQALPAPIREEASRLTTSVLSDASAWGSARRASVAEPWRLEHFESLQDAVLARRRVRLGYRSSRGAASRRLVDPLGLVVKRAVWYLLADTDGGRRSFRVDRVTDVEITDEPARRPDDFDLREAWDLIVAEYREHSPRFEVQAILEPWVVPALRTLGVDVVELADRADGRLVARLEAMSVEVLAASVAGVTDGITLVDATAVEERLAVIGRTLTARFGHQPSTARGRR